LTHFLAPKHTVFRPISTYDQIVNRPSFAEIEKLADGTTLPEESDDEDETKGSVQSPNTIISDNSASPSLSTKDHRAARD
jgi:hypothetical protein